MRRATLLVMLCLAVAAEAQTGPEKGGHDLGLWTAGGVSVPGGTQDVGTWNAGARFGWVLTDPHLPGILRGRFEYAVDAVPVYMVFQNGATYGAGFNPLVLKWNFVGNKKVAPFAELAGGTLFSTDNVPRVSPSQVNFTSGAAVGLQFLGHRFNPTIALRYAHISNAGLASPNPGINTIQFQIGINHFTPGYGKH